MCIRDSLKEKEFTLHHRNFTTVGTQAAVLAGFSVTALVEFGAPRESNRVLLFCFYASLVFSLSANVLCVGKTTLLSVFGTSLAMRGPDGAMISATQRHPCSIALLHSLRGPRIHEYEYSVEL